MRSLGGAICYQLIMNRKKAFSLLELLIAVAIAGILVMLVIAGFGKTREMADGSTCTSNLRKIGIAAHQYAADNGNTLPGPMVAVTVASYGSGQPNNLAGYLYPYFDLPPKPPGVPDLRAAMFECPATKSVVLRKGVQAATVRYFFSPRNFTKPDGKSYYPFGYRNSITAVPEPPLKLSEVPEPSKVILLIDADQELIPDYKGNITMAEKPAHSVKRNILFMDAHVEAQSVKP